MFKGTVVILVGPEYEDLELWYPKLRLESAGYDAPVAGLGEKAYVGKHGYPCFIDGDVADFKPDISGIVVPGGWAPDRLRRDNKVLSLIRDVREAGGLVATICHGPSVLISAGIVGGRRMTSSLGIRDDLTSAGAKWVDEPVVVDENIISSRAPKDLPAFGEAIVSWLDSHTGQRGAVPRRPAAVRRK
ncbi:MAG TPA: type 1 glutamine amidotransferase domain-containing protein [Gemmatimonadaceae bacterium]|nr:type 1 glutamine amidotransferase domain-containing protein [Gemmatimonadaceae bacterium]